MQKKRFEILLPLKHNDGRVVSPELFEQTRQELVAQFGGISLHPNIVQGTWLEEGVKYEDDLLRFVIDVEDSEENSTFFKSHKSTLLERFDQIEIYIVSYPVEIH